MVNPTEVIPLSRLILCLMLVAVWPICLPGQSEFEKPPVSYSTTAADDPVARLQRALDQAKTRLEWDEEQGWLPSLLEKLDVPVDSQSLVFSKTSLQLTHISPRNPRAIFFNDDAYVGYVPGGTLIELSAVDEQLGAVFYSIRQDRQDPRIVRDESRCMTCHGTSKTQNVPGFLVRSVFAGASGQPHYNLGTLTTSHRTPFRDRFGGWYVTGTHGKMRHRGNALARNSVSEPIDREQFANSLSLPDTIDLEDYPVATSDIVALMVLEHQSQMHNLITRASYETRQALHYQKEMNIVLDRDQDYLSDTTKRRIRSAGDKLVEYLLFSGEFELESPVRGNSEFARVFSAAGPRDSKGRSLREFDLERRMFKYPCSFLIYSSSFDALPPMMMDYVERKLLLVLQGDDDSGAFEHLTTADRDNLLQILLETKPRLKIRLAKLDQPAVVEL